jgi:hypothetical protein
MNHVERFRAVMNFQAADRLPRIEWATWWDQTIRRWRGEGLQAEGDDIRRGFGLDPYWQWWFRCISPSYPPALGPLGGSVGGMDRYLKVRPHLYAIDEAGFETLAKWADVQRRGECVVWITLEGFFWWPRVLMGIERHLYAFYDSPELMHRINEDMSEWHLRILDRLANVCRPAFMTFAEDMSYNHGPMLSKRLFDEFMLPYYRKVIPRLQEMGTTVFIDSDGDVTEMVPWLLAAGIEGVLPLERQAGVDAASLRRDFPRFLMIGHYDKMVMNRGEDAIRAEFERLLPVMRTGGFIPSVDHQTPPGVSLEEYWVYLRLLEEYGMKAG